MSENNKDKDNIFPAWLGLRALESTSYKNSAYALSEVVDNSVDAGAKSIHVAIICENNGVTPDIIAIWDNGKGMDGEGLRSAIQYGNNGEPDRVENKSSRRKKLGRFGVGLLSATFNQCHSLEVWSWQDGIDSDDKAMNVGLDASVIKKSQDNSLPAANKKKLPEFFRRIFGSEDTDMEHGTLVVWRKFHKLSWKKAKTLQGHLLFECGRIYRNLIGQGKVKITLSIWSSDYQKIDSRRVTIVDPMFLKKWDDPALKDFDGPMFRPYGRGVKEDNRLGEDGTYAGAKIPVYDDSDNILGYYTIQASHRKIPDVVKKSQEGNYKDPGFAPYGKLAKKLQGVSILREGRELILDPKWLPADNTVSRWISISIDFEAKLDEVFGVDNSKQEAHHLSALAGVDRQSLSEAAENKEVEKVAETIYDLIKDMIKVLKDERKTARTRQSRNMSPIALGDGRLQQLGDLGAQRHSAGNRARYDDENPKDDIENLKKAYDGTYYEEKDGEDVLAVEVRPDHVIAKNLKVDFVKEPDGGGAFFSVRQRQGVLLVVLNQDHPLFDRLREVCTEEDIDEDVENLSCEARLRSAQDSLDNAVWVIHRLLYCYARAETEARGGDSDEYEEVRIKWGRIVKRMMQEDDI